MSARASRFSTGRVAMALYVALALVALVRLDVAPPPGQIPPGSEALFSEMLGAGAALPDGCALSGADIDHTRVVARYACVSGPALIIELRHPSDGAGADRRTGRFALFVPAAAPPRFVSALVERIVTREARFTWGAPAQPPGDLGRTPVPARALLAALLVLAGAAAWAAARTVRTLLATLRSRDAAIDEPQPAGGGGGEAPIAREPDDGARSVERRAFVPWFAVVLGLLVAAAVALRGLLAARTVLTFDEVWLQRYPDPLAYLHGPEAQMNPPLYPLLTWPVAALSGGDPVAERGVAVVLGGALVVLVALLAGSALGRRGALLAAAAAALHPMAVAVGAANRAYALAPLMVALALAATARALATRGARDRLAAAVLAAALLYTHYVLAGVAAGLALWVLLDEDRAALRGWAPPALVAAALAAPLAVPLYLGALEKAAIRRGGLPGHPLALLGEGTRVLSGGAPATVLGHTRHLIGARPLPLPSILAVLAALGVAALVMRRPLRRGVLACGLCGLAAPVLMVRHLDTVRDVSFVGALAPVLLGLAAICLPERWLSTGAGRASLRRALAVALPIVLAAAFAPSLAVYLREPDPGGTRMAARAVLRDPALPVVGSFVGSWAILRRELSAMGRPPEELRAADARFHHLASCTPAALRAAAGNAPRFLLGTTFCHFDELGLRDGDCREVAPWMLLCALPGENLSNVR